MLPVCLKLDEVKLTLYIDFRYKEKKVLDSWSKIQAKQKEGSDLIRSCYNPNCVVMPSISEPSYDTLLFWSRVKSCLQIINSSILKFYLEITS